MYKQFATVVLVTLGLAVSQVTTAALVTQKWAVTDAQTSDKYDNHGLWTNGLGSDENEKRHSFQSGSMLTEYNDGTAHLMATAKNRHDRTATINIWFDGKQSNTDYTGPIKTGGGSDTSDWHFYTTVSKGLITFDTLPSSFFEVKMVNDGKGPVLQIGTGANDKNSAFGASTWLDVYVLQLLKDQEQQISLLGDYGKKLDTHWDLNMNLTAVPVPAAVWLFGSALLGFMGLRKKAS